MMILGKLPSVMQRNKIPFLEATITE